MKPNTKADRLQKIVKFQKNRSQKEYAHRQKVKKRQLWPKSKERFGRIAELQDDGSGRYTDLRRQR